MHDIKKNNLNRGNNGNIDHDYNKDNDYCRKMAVIKITMTKPVAIIIMTIIMATVVLMIMVMYNRGREEKSFGNVGFD